MLAPAAGLEGRLGGFEFEFDRRKEGLRDGPLDDVDDLSFCA